MKYHMAIASLLIAACSPEPKPVDDRKLEDALAKIEKAEADLKKAMESSAQGAPAAASKALASVDEVKSDLERTQKRRTYTGRITGFTTEP